MYDLYKFPFSEGIHASPFSSSRYIFFIYLCTLASQVQAGQLFPPNNIGQNTNVPCPNGELLTWNGDHVDCTNPTPGVSVSCPAGQFLTGISNGSPICAPDNDSVSIACPAGQFLSAISNGSPVCATPAAAKEISISVGELSQYHNNCKNPFTDYMSCAAACSRFCNNGCVNGAGDGSCAPINNANTYKGGVLSEWNGVNANCTCFF